MEREELFELFEWKEYFEEKSKASWENMNDFYHQAKEFTSPLVEKASNEFYEKLGKANAKTKEFIESMDLEKIQKVLKDYPIPTKIGEIGIGAGLGYGIVAGGFAAIGLGAAGPVFASYW